MVWFTNQCNFVNLNHITFTQIDNSHPLAVRKNCIPLIITLGFPLERKDPSKVTITLMSQPKLFLMASKEGFTVLSASHFPEILTYFCQVSSLMPADLITSITNNRLLNVISMFFSTAFLYIDFN